jgi:hypothetical protein
VLTAHLLENKMQTPIVTLKFEKYKDEGLPHQCIVEIFSDGAGIDGDEIGSYIFEFLEPEDALLRAVQEVIKHGYVLSSNQTA